MCAFASIDIKSSCCKSGFNNKKEKGSFCYYHDKVYFENCGLFDDRIYGLEPQEHLL
jgi:hypothetical protein